MTGHEGAILVTGATGKQGAAAARHLLHGGWKVRALVRDPGAPAALALAEAGADLARGDFDDHASLTAAMDGVRGVFGVPPATFGPDGWDEELEYTRGASLVDAAAAAGVGHFVFASIASFPGQPFPGTDAKRRIEGRAEASGMRWTHLRPVRFMENYLLREGPIDGIHGGLNRHFFRPDHRMQLIAVDDIGAFAALAFADPDRFHGAILELAGDELAPTAAAAAITAATGRDVRYGQVPRAEARALGPAILGVWEVVNGDRSWSADLAALRVIHPGLRTFDTWLKEGGADRIAALP
ncbi:NmrA family NAD(P)-binding protein [Glycomyces harbinensis]|uniref:Uncharacterized conserved protein YbjT, contains NAD(P)-binding and DUF2867 domains n=1 Tax=Glycomyces harbinensis TaxID=58114 RepID=A0A1G6VD10_9ACTN|nr:NmrA family NAD(P)-binding protein [Glycomyces harbinensis]SDD50897.1 Uncharacterized conserved protein YbjT, contains NAD(P)-binding and DUF2867 domains [Glycomyces harbinensis]